MRCQPNWPFDLEFSCARNYYSGVALRLIPRLKKRGDDIVSTYRSRIAIRPTLPLFSALGDRMCQSSRELPLPNDKTAKVLRLPNSNAQIGICFVPDPASSLEKTPGVFPRAHGIGSHRRALSRRRHSHDRL
jgi:hypothetical protein